MCDESAACILFDERATWKICVMFVCGTLPNRPGDGDRDERSTCVSQGQICSDNCMCYHTEIEGADQTFCLTQSQYTDTGPSSPSADPITPGAWQGRHWNTKFETHGMTGPGKKIHEERRNRTQVGCSRGKHLALKPARKLARRRCEHDPVCPWILYVGV